MGLVKSLLERQPKVPPPPAPPTTPPEPQSPPNPTRTRRHNPNPPKAYTTGEGEVSEADVIAAQKLWAESIASISKVHP